LSTVDSRRSARRAVAHAEQELGSIELGKYGDLLLIDRDVMTVEPARIPGTSVLLTVIGGEIVYERAR